MSKSDFMEKLLDGIEVEWIPLGNVTQYEQPTKYLGAVDLLCTKFNHST